MSSPHVARIGVIIAGTEPPIEGFKEGLTVFGLIEGRDITFELRVAQGQLDRLPGFAAEMVEMDVDIIAVLGAVTVRAARAATVSIPIVFAVVVEPIGDDLTVDIKHPGGNVTGVTSFDPLQAKTQIEFLLAVKPDITRVAILSDVEVSECLSNSNRQAALDLGLKPQVIRVGAPSPDYDKVFADFEHERAQALIVVEEPINQANRHQIAHLATGLGMPSVFPMSMLDAGGLIGYGTSFREAARQMASHAHKILTGTRAGELPIEAVKRHELVINMQAARKLGLDVGSELLDRCDRVIA
jgi:putative tryptophan/tyrosine transport system substrate-binding protein